MAAQKRSIRLTLQAQKNLRFWSLRKNLALARSTAQDPTADPAVLGTLSQLKDPEVLRSLAQNPSTPTKELLTIAERFPAAFIENPILPLLLLENPYAVFGWRESLRERLLLCPSLPSELFGLIVSRGAERFCRLAEDPSAPTALLELLASQTNLRRSLLLQHPNATPKTIAIVVNSTTSALQGHAYIARRLGDDYQRLLRRAGLWGEPMRPSPALSTQDLIALSELGERARALVAAHPECPIELLLRLIDDKASAVCHRAALHPKIPSALLPELIARFDEIATLLAMDPRLSAQQLTTLSAKEDKHETAEGIAKNPSCPPELLRTLLWHEHQPAREAASQNPNTPQDELERLLQLGASLSMTPDGLPDPSIQGNELEALSTHTGAFVLMLVARHPNTPLHVLRTLSTKTESIRSALLRNPAVLHQLTELFEGNPHLAMSAASKKNLPTEIYERLCEHPSIQVKRRLAANSTLPYSLLERLSQDPDANVRSTAQRQLLLRQVALEEASITSHKKRRHPRPLKAFLPDDE